MTGRIFSVQSFKSKVMGKGNVLKLCVNFQPEVIALSKEVGTCACMSSLKMDLLYIYLVSFEIDLCLHELCTVNVYLHLYCIFSFN